MRSIIKALHHYEEHHKGPSPLFQIGIRMETQVPLDYMHLVCLGVIKKLQLLWVRGSLKCRLLSLGSYIPKEFARKPCDTLERWKTTEFRLFLLYTGPIALAGRVAKEMYDNFMLLFVGIYILANPALCYDLNDYAQSILVQFVHHCS